MPLHTFTPLIPSHALSHAGGPEIWLKLDALQPCGSFKLRGIGHACETLARQGLAGMAYADRKSTRLNSSHSQISYAVFCLKKKTQQNTKQHRSQYATMLLLK